ncbi:uncharacterized protein LOC126616047 [Malus sylvestris]|uniref:uncharacterized protein LOC126616047 n=1 Tax=Malus sylvestris TaxID=3752 RepID=UPI0021ACD8D7|nr:uncharacterized protein LOC126616047 [Malus sylvestris]
MIKLSAYVMTEYDDILQEVKRYKVKFQENKQLVDDARKMSKAWTEVVQLKDQTLERLKRRNDENLRLKKQLEATILKASQVRGERDIVLAEVSELNKSLLAERETVV